MSRPMRRQRGEREAQRVRAEGGDALRELLARRLLDGGLHLRLHQARVRFATSASRSMPSMRSSGSMMLPFDFDIFLPCSSRISPVM